MADPLPPRTLRASIVVAARAATAPVERARALRQLALDHAWGKREVSETLPGARPGDAAPLPETLADATPRLALARAPASPFAAPPSAAPPSAAPHASPDAPVVHVPPGRLVELCAGPDGAQTSAAVMALREAQREGDPVAWVMPRGAGLFPPDLAAAGVDLDALAVVHVPPEDPAAVPRAAELLLRCGAFGAVVLDLGAALLPRGAAWQGRLLGLAREHACRVVVLSPHGPSRASLGPLVSLRFDVRRERVAPGKFRLVVHALKDKSGLLGSHEASRPCVAPVGAG